MSIEQARVIVEKALAQGYDAYWQAYPSRGGGRDVFVAIHKRKGSRLASFDGVRDALDWLHQQPK